MPPTQPNLPPPSSPPHAAFFAAAVAATSHLQPPALAAGLPQPAPRPLHPPPLPLTPHCPPLTLQPALGCLPPASAQLHLLLSCLPPPAPPESAAAASRMGTAAAPQRTAPQPTRSPEQCEQQKVWETVAKIPTGGAWYTASAPAPWPLAFTSHTLYPCTLLPAPCTLLPAPCSLLPAPPPHHTALSLAPRTSDDTSRCLNRLCSISSGLAAVTPYPAGTARHSSTACATSASDSPSQAAAAAPASASVGTGPSCGSVEKCGRGQ